MTFEQHEQTENHSQIENIVEELKTANLSLSNYKKFHDRLRNTVQIIDAQIENDRQNYDDIYNTVQETKSSDAFEQCKIDNVVPLDMYKNMVTLIKMLKDAISWEILKSNIYNILYDKLVILIDEANAVQVRRDALNEMREMEKERNKAITEALGHKMAMFDEKVMVLVKQMQDDHRNDLRYSLMVFENIIKILSNQYDVKEVKTEIEQKKEELTQEQKQVNKPPRNFMPEMTQTSPQEPEVPRPNIFKEENESADETIEDIEKEFNETAEDF